MSKLIRAGTVLMVSLVFASTAWAQEGAEKKLQRAFEKKKIELKKDFEKRMKELDEWYRDAREKLKKEKEKKRPKPRSLEEKRKELERKLDELKKKPDGMKRLFKIMLEIAKKGFKDGKKFWDDFRS